MIFGYFFALAYIIIHTILKCVEGLLKMLAMVFKVTCRVLNKLSEVLSQEQRGKIFVPASLFISLRVQV